MNINCQSFESISLVSSRELKITLFHLVSIKTKRMATNWNDQWKITDHYLNAGPPQYNHILKFLTVTLFVRDKPKFLSYRCWSVNFSFAKILDFISFCCLLLYFYTLCLHFSTKSKWLNIYRIPLTQLTCFTIY